MNVKQSYNMRYILLFVLFMVSTLSVFSKSNELGFAENLVMDDEYEMFRKQGDDLFKAGQYDKALNKYLSCLEVPGYETDNYAYGRIDNCRKAMELKADINRLNGLNQLENATASVDALLKINPADEQVRNLVFSFWVNRGNQAMYRKYWQEASDSFIKALAYKADADVDKKLQRCENMLIEGKVVRPPMSALEVNKKQPSDIPLKVGMAGVAVGGVLYALSLNTGWQTRLDAIVQAQTNGDRSQYQQAYQDAKNYQSKLGIRNASIAAAIVVAGIDTFLFIKKPKSANFQVRPDGLGMALQVRLQ